MTEEWKPVAGYEGRYKVSNFGRVASVGRNGIPDIVLKPQVDFTGYHRVNLYKGRKMFHKSVHRLVADAFVDNPHQKQQVNHIDGNKSNNSACNLEWCTPKENIRHSMDTGLRSNGKAVDMYTADGRYVKTFDSLSDASRETGALVQSIAQCCKGRKGYCTARGYVWKYHEGGIDNV